MKKLQTTLDKITTLISAILCAAMMVILFANVVLRLIPGIGGFKWYMESSQYLNVWSMLIACIGINAMGTNLRVEVADSIFGKNRYICTVWQQKRDSQSRFRAATKVGGATTSH